MNTKRDKVQKEKDEIGERIRPKITENNGKTASLKMKFRELQRREDFLSWLGIFGQRQK